MAKKNKISDETITAMLGFFRCIVTEEAVKAAAYGPDVSTARGDWAQTVVASLEADCPECPPPGDPEPDPCDGPNPPPDCP